MVQLSELNIGMKVKVTKGMHEGKIGFVERVYPGNELLGVQGECTMLFENGKYRLTLPMSILHEEEMSLFEQALYDAEITKTVKRIGTISTVFTEADTSAIFTESAKLSNIREATYKDVTSNHFIDWFFKLDNWVGHNPQGFPFEILTHNDKDSAYGYFNGSKLDGMICVDAFGEISFFCVNPACQKHGIGQYLFQYAIDKHSDKDLVLHVYTDNNPAIHIYEKYGFTKTGIGYDRGYSPELPHYIMKKEGIEE